MNAPALWRPNRSQRGASTLKGIAALVALLILILLLIVGFYEGRKMYWDWQVREMCAKDGGIKVYETVKLPADMFNQWHQPYFYRPSQGENALGQEYVFINQSNYLRQGDPDLWRTHITVVRRSDMKILGESTSYSRRGGDVPGPWHPSSFGCPSDRGDIPLLTRVFQH